MERIDFKSIYSAIIAVLLGFTIAAIFLQTFGLNALEAYSAMFLGAFSTPYKVAETLLRSSSFMLAALGFALAFKAGYWNLGIEGQMYMGMFFTLLGGIYFSNLPPILHIAVGYLFGFLGAGVWSLISGFLKAKYGVNEILTTLMMNFVGHLIVHYFVYYPFSDIERIQVEGKSIPIAASAELPIIISGTRLHFGIVISLILPFMIYMFLKKSVLGYNIRAVGSGTDAARFSGVSVANTVMIASFLSGGIAGLGAANEVLGVYHCVQHGAVEGYGFIGIAAAMLALNNPLGIILSSIFFGFLYSGSVYMTRGAGLTIGAVQFFVGIMILVTLVSPLIEKIIERKKPKPLIATSTSVHGSD